MTTQQDSVDVERLRAAVEEDPFTNVGDVHVAVEYMLKSITDLPERGSPAFEQIVSALTRGYVFGRCSR